MNPYPFIYTTFGIAAFVLIGYMGLQLRHQMQNRRLLALLTKGTDHAK